MGRCSRCGAEHELLDPVFARPDDVARLAPDARSQHVRESDDVCVVRLPDAAPRFFVRGVLPVEVGDYPDGVWWGLWAEISEQAHDRIHELWDDERQASEPPLAGALANRVPGYPETMGLAVSIQLTGPTSRPEFRFAHTPPHPFVEECRAGVSPHHAARWNALMQGG